MKCHYGEITIQTIVGGLNLSAEAKNTVYEVA